MSVLSENGGDDNRMAASTAQKNLKPHIAEKWEVEAIGQFLFEEYRNLLFGVRTDWLTQKSDLRYKFRKYLDNDKNGIRERLLEANGTYDIGTLLYRCNYLINTEKGSNFYRIKNSALFEYINKRCDELDEKQKNGMSTEFMSNENGSKTSTGYGDPAITGSLQVDENAPTHELLYEGSQQQERSSIFQLTNMGCYICQMNFTSPDDFENHVETHGDESDFEILNNYDKSTTSIFKLSYNVCKDSHYFRFNLAAARPNIIIEKLVVVQTRTFYYVNNTRVPYALGEDRSDYFFVDSHLFRKGVVQPIVVVFHEKSKKGKRIVEQHHFCRVEEFPAVKMSFNPCRLSDKIKFKPIFPLPHFMPPAEIRNALRTDFIEGPLTELSNDFKDYLSNDKTLTQQNIREVLLKLLQIEDWDTMREYSSLVQRNVKLRTYENDYIIKLKTPKHIRVENIIFPFDDAIILPSDEDKVIPTSLEGLMDKMEQLIDALSKQEKKKSKSFCGFIDCVSNGRVTFKCDKKIPVDKTYTVLFRPSRMVLRYQYRALEQLVAMPQLTLKQFLFPDIILPRQMSVIRLDLLNKAIYKNPEQYQAIQCVVDSVGKQSAPYIIFGPPGTGKTTTLVEAIYQLYMLQPQSRILITAGSNGACDEIALRLCIAFGSKIEPNTITRIYARSYENRAENLNDVLLEHSNLYGDHFLPAVSVLHTYRIVVCTLSIVGRLATGKFGKEMCGDGVFTHVFVDEVAASTEAETLVGLMSTLSAKANLIISGDHRQLGPILNSQRAAALGLEVSLMERLLKRECYRVDEYGNYNRQIQTRLCRNYRSHQEIVNLYSEMYYDGHLIAEAASDVQKLCRDWYRSPNAEYPIIFHSIFGPEQRDKNSTSRYNPLEVATVMDYVRDLLYFGIKGHKITQSDIGIITPYKKQYMRIQEELNLRNWYQVETGAVESFQGKEKNIIIVSFVRSFSNSLGFLDCPKRLNVILSRARSLLILIGNPRTLSISSDFKSIIDKCQAHKTLVGAKYFDDDGINPNRAAAKGKNLNGKMEKLNKSMSELNVSKENITQINTNNADNNENNDNQNDAKKSQHAKQRRCRTKKNAQKKAQSNEAAFKTAKPKSAEKQRHTFERYKDLCLTDELYNNAGDKNTTKRMKSDIDELFDVLPRVPCNKTPRTKAKDDDFEIIDLPTNQNAMHDAFLQRLDRLQRTQAQAQAPKTQATTTSAGVGGTATSQRPGSVSSGGNRSTGNLPRTNTPSMGIKTNVCPSGLTTNNTRPSVVTTNTRPLGLTPISRPLGLTTNHASSGLNTNTRPAVLTTNTRPSAGTASMRPTGLTPINHPSGLTNNSASSGQTANIRPSAMAANALRLGLASTNRTTVYTTASNGSNRTSSTSISGRSPIHAVNERTTQRAEEVFARTEYPTQFRYARVHQEKKSSKCVIA